MQPLEKLRAAGATVHVVSLKEGEIKGWDETDWGQSVPVDKVLGQVSVNDYDALVLPGGQINPDKLRAEESVVSFRARLLQHEEDARRHLPCAVAAGEAGGIVKAETSPRSSRSRPTS